MYNVTTFFKFNLKGTPMRTKEALLAMGPEAPIMEVLEVFTDGPNHDWARRDMARVKAGIESEGRHLNTIGDLSTYTSSEISGPQARYTGNKSKAWMGWVLREFGLKHRITGY